MTKIKNIKEIFRPLLPNVNKNIVKKNVLYFINLTKFHVYEQLLLEESLYRLSSFLSEGLNNVGFVVVNNTINEIEENKNYYDKSVILGISGKIDDHIKDVNYIKENKICLIKRFTGGGTVYINRNCLLVSLILPHNFCKLLNIYPSNVTEWSFNSFYGMFLNQKKNSLFSENFGYLENDYVCKIYDEKRKEINLKKVGGNAQAFSKNYFVHHTSFIWSCNHNEMKNILLNPLKQPAYRNKRNHYDFIESLKSCLQKCIKTPDSFIKKLICHIRKIVDIKNSNEQDDFWFFNKININMIDNSSDFQFFDNLYYTDFSSLRELFLLYNNNIYTNNLRSTYFLDVEGNRVSDTYYKIPSFILTENSCKNILRK
ncbi:lipoate-protein ligase 2, putative [Plasmodium gallinaceum]|uniref:Lipoate-protein ligase 2, putative n=1 Tax=Plasmodium gallinaceum TaxID=5849 RepID=A0A1J1GWD4_PLAGA|nr:lipoate-protein ligase 2, putative [Plasmodium gallinaceum]CRG96783.1 lipoate-protein ligase 2, putative [Plasmodium gallinaceum]